MSGNVRSILAMLVAMLFFALMDAVLKQLTALRLRWPVHRGQPRAILQIAQLPKVFEINAC